MQVNYGTLYNAFIETDEHNDALFTLMLDALHKAAQDKFEEIDTGALRRALNACYWDDRKIIRQDILDINNVAGRGFLAQAVEAIDEADCSFGAHMLLMAVTERQYMLDSAYG